MKLTFGGNLHSASASRRKLLQVQRKGDIGSPRSSGTMRASKSRTSPKSITVSGLRPDAPDLTRPTARGGACAESSLARVQLAAAIRVIRDTAAIPPRAIAWNTSSPRTTAGDVIVQDAAKALQGVAESVARLVMTLHTSPPKSNVTQAKAHARVRFNYPARESKARAADRIVAIIVGRSEPMGVPPQYRVLFLEGERAGNSRQCP